MRSQPTRKVSNDTQVFPRPCHIHGAQTHRFVAQVLDATVEVRGFAQQCGYVFGSHLIEERTVRRRCGGRRRSRRRHSRLLVDQVEAVAAAAAAAAAAARRTDAAAERITGRPSDAICVAAAAARRATIGGRHSGSGRRADVLPDFGGFALNAGN